jgi:hypothetical protein
MPIIELANPGSPLSQGDILKDVTLFVTAELTTASTGVPQKLPHSMCLVLSRPCGIEHKESVIVASVARLKDDVPRQLDNFAKVQSFLTGLRDGLTSPDIFYLGQLPGLTGRYGARFDNLHVIQLPLDGPDRKAFVASKRVAGLHADFTRDLHVRLFRAVASLGFDDDGWLSDADLDWLLNRGRTDLMAAQATTQELITQRASQKAKGGQFDEKQLLASETTEQSISAALLPYEKEHERRAFQRKLLELGHTQPQSETQDAGQLPP